MSPVSAIERTELCTIATMSAAARAGKLEYVVVRSGLEVYGPRTRARVGARRRRRCPSRARRTAGRCSRSSRSSPGVAAAPRRAGVRAALRAGGRSARPEPARPVAAAAGRAGAARSPIRRSRCCIPTTRPRRWSPRSSTATTARCNIVGPGAATPWQAVRLGGRVPLPVVGPMWDVAARVVELAGAAIAPHVIELLRHGRTGAGEPRGRSARPHAISCRRRRCCASCSSGPT